MKILFLTHTFPYPLNEGVRLHLYHILKELAKKHTLFLLCLNDTPVSREEQKAIEELGVKIVKILLHQVPKNFWFRCLNTFFDSVPFFVRQFESSELRQELNLFLSKEDVDVVHVDYLSMAIYYEQLRGLPAIFFPHDAVSMMYEKNISKETNLFRKLYTFLQWQKIKRFESQWIPKFDSCMVVSPVDRDYLLGHCPGAIIYDSPNGVDTEHFLPMGGEEEGAVLFRGVMDFLPNADAVRFFCLKIFPMICKKFPKAKFVVVGKSPPADLLRLSRNKENIIFTGYVPDIREPMAKASVIVCPMRIGSGIKNKILEPMAMAKAVVATPLACAGLQVIPEEHLFTEKEPDAFAERVVQLLKDSALRKEIGKNARTFVMQNHTWKRNADDFEKLYLEATRAGVRNEF